MVSGEKLIGFLKTLWGALATTTAFLPGVAAFFKISIALENSPLKALYPILGTSVSSFVLLFLVSRPEWFASWKKTAWLSAISLLIGFVLLIATLLGRSTMDFRHQATYPANSAAAMFAMPEAFMTTPGGRMFSGNVINEQAEVRETWDHGRGIKEFFINGKIQKSLEYYEMPLEFLLLLSFVSSMVFFTVAFAALGVYSYLSGRRLG